MYQTLSYVKVDSTNRCKNECNFMQLREYEEKIFKFIYNELTNLHNIFTQGFKISNAEGMNEKIR